jgi:molybdate transport system substrate-binding protein
MNTLKKAFLSILIFGFFSGAFAQNSEKILIGAASDLKFALDSIVVAFHRSDERSVQVTYGASGKLYEQISNGAPFDLYFSADINYPKLLKEKGVASSEVYPYGVGHLVIWSKRIDPNAEGIKSLVSPSIRKVAIANPEHAPYGKRAMETLEYYGLVSSVQSKLVLGENISQTAQFVTSGAADIGIIALSLALSPAMKRMGGKYFPVPQESHQPLLQGAVITRRAGTNDLAKSFFEFVKTDQAVAILTYFGFAKPDAND